jgi:hypothetical protein
MANIIKIKRGLTAGFQPTGLTLGELAVNVADGRLFVGSTGSIVELGSTPVGAALLALPNTFTDTNIFQGVVNIENTTPSNSVSTGALVVYGGVGIQEDLYVQGTIYSNGVPVGSGSVNIPIASSSITGAASFNATDFNVSALGAVSLTAGIVKSINGQTGNVTLSSLPAVIPIASSSVTGVASFGNEFIVSALGAVSITSNHVKSFNGLTGSVLYATPVATQSLTGVASFNSSYFTVSGLGAVSLASTYQVTGDTVVAGSRISVSRSGNTVTIGSNSPVATSSVTGVASFTDEFVVSNLGSVSLTANYVKSFNGFTGSVVYAPSVATQSLTGVASFDSTYFSVSGLGAVSLAPSYQVTGDSVTAGNRIVITKTGNLARIENAVPLGTTSITGVNSYNPVQFFVTNVGQVNLFRPNNVTVPPDGFVPPTVYGSDIECQKVMYQTNKYRLLSYPDCGATTISDNLGKQVITNSTTKVLLVQGAEPNEYSFTPDSGSTGGITASIVSISYHHAADVTVFAYTDDQINYSIRKFMILGNQNGSGAKFTEYSNISTGTELGTFAIEATGYNDYWGLVVTPSSSAKTYFDINTIIYKGLNQIV